MDKSDITKRKELVKLAYRIICRMSEEQLEEALATLLAKRKEEIDRIVEEIAS